MSGFAEVLAGETPIGVHHTDASVEELRSQAEAASWRFAYVDASTLDTREGVLLALGGALGFPSYFTGRSLDGLHDCLIDVADPTVLVLDGWSTLADADPRGAEKLLRVLAVRADESPAFEVLLRGSEGQSPVGS